MPGSNKLTVGGGVTATYNYVSHGNYTVVTSAAVSISAADLDLGTDTVSCTQVRSTAIAVFLMFLKRTHPTTDSNRHTHAC